MRGSLGRLAVEDDVLFLRRFTELPADLSAKDCAPQSGIERRGVWPAIATTN